MKNTYKATLLIALGLASVSTIEAQTSDLLLGLNDAAGPQAAQNDYVIDLGLTGNQLVAETAPGQTTDLSSALTSAFAGASFNSAFGNADANALNDVAAGVVGGITGNPAYLFQTSLVGNSPTVLSPTGGSSVYNDSLNSAGASTIGEYNSASTTGWTWNVAASPTALGTETSGNDVSARTGNPLGQLSAGVLDLTLWESTETKSGTHFTVQSWVDEGTIAINLNSDTIGFTAVPEPPAYSLFAAAGLLAVAIRRKSSLKNS